MNKRKGREPIATPSQHDKCIREKIRMLINELQASNLFNSPSSSESTPALNPAWTGWMIVISDHCYQTPANRT